MFPILARYGPFFLYSYTVVMGLGIAAGIGLTYWLENHDGQDHPNWLEGFFIAAFAGLVGGRVAFVWANWSYYQQQPGEIGLVWLGGLSYHGALLVGLLAFWVWTKWRDYSFHDYAGLLAPGLIVASAFGWLACWLDGCAFGQEAGPGWFVSDLPDGYGIYGLRYQTQLAGLAFAVLTFFIILLLRRRVRPVSLFWAALLFLAVGRFIVTLLRGDDVPMFRQVRLDTLAEAATMLLSCLILISFFFVYRYKNRPS